MSGRARWSDSTFRYADTANADLAYAVTGHSAQGLTVSHGIAVVTGSESRQWLYSAMTRGADCNQAVVFTQPARPADLAAGTRPAPELARYRRLRAERDGQPMASPFPARNPDPREPMAVLADVLERDEAQDAAVDVLGRELSDADHLGRLEVMWQGETLPARRDAWRAAIRQALPPQYRRASLDGGTATWLWRTLRAAEAAGFDAGQVAADAISAAPLTGARDVAAVLDARIRRASGGIAPAPWRPWSQRVPSIADPARRQFVTELAAAMDARRVRIGEHAADTAPAWAVNALGPVPENPVDRLEWTERASAVGAYRELYGIESDTDPVGPEPVNSPEARSAWMAAYSAQLRLDPAGLDALPDSSLLLRRAQYQAETVWAPPYPGRELRRVRMAQLEMTSREVRHTAEAATARAHGDAGAAERHARLAESAQAASEFYAARAKLDEHLEAARKEWDAHTAPVRLQAVQADAVLRRRHPELQLEPLRSAEPDPLPDELPNRSPAAGERHAAFVAGRLARFRGEMDMRGGLLIADKDPGYLPDGTARRALGRPRRDAVLQPPRPLMTPPPIQRDREMEPQA